MVMHFAEPIWLWALAGLIVPLTIHLLSRKGGKEIPMGSLRFLRESASARYQHLKLNEIALLLMRCLLIILLVLLLAGAWSTWFQPKETKWLVLEEGVESAPGVSHTIQNLKDQGFETRSLRHGFPLASQDTFQEPITNYWMAARQLTAYSLDSVVVLGFNYQRNFKGQRISQPPHMSWLVAEAGKRRFIAHQFLTDDDSVWTRQGTTTPLGTSFDTRMVSASSRSDSIQPTAAGELNVSIFTDENFAYDERILLAALKAVQSISKTRINVNIKKPGEQNNQTSDVIFWLADDAPPANSGTVAFAYGRCGSQALPLLLSSAEALFDCGDYRNVTWIFTKRLTEEVALAEDLPLKLATLMLPESEVSYDNRVLPESMAWAKRDNTQSAPPDLRKKGNTDLYLIILVMLTLVGERALAFNRKQ